MSKRRIWLVSLLLVGLSVGADWLIFRPAPGLSASETHVADIHHETAPHQEKHAEQHGKESRPDAHSAGHGEARSDKHVAAGHGKSRNKAGHNEFHGEAAHGSGHGDGHGSGHGGGHHEEEARKLTPADSPLAWLPLACILLPVFGGVLAIICHKSDRQRDIIVVSTVVVTSALLVAMYPVVVPGIHLHGQLFRGISLSLYFLPGFPMTFNVDPVALVVCMVTAFLWILSGVYAISYMTIEDKRPRYEFFMLATLGADLGVMLAGDFMTLFICFESLLLFPYALIAHKENPGALRGANMCFYLGSVASLGMLGGIAMLGSYTGSITIQPMAKAMATLLPGNLRYIIAALMIIGFGGKAGLFLEHSWLPNAHPVAPTPASCLLSGAMIKAGAYGIIRVCCTLFAPPKGVFDAMQWINMRYIGYAVIWVGIIGMFLAVLSALITPNSKRMLAFHSVSQMGYIVMGIGVAAYLGKDGAMGLAGALYHMVNHALFKASLFLGVGAVYFRTHELDMYKLGGLWRNMPVCAVGLFIAACGIAGIPGFNGFASKTILHHAINEAYAHSAHFSPYGYPDFKLRVAEIIFMITAGGTFASNMKLFALTFLRKRPEKYRDVAPAPIPMRIAIGMVSVAILFIGLNPNWMLEHLIGPALAYFHYDPASHPYHILYNTHALKGAAHSIIPILYPIGKEVAGAASEVVHNLLGGGTAVMMGGMYFIIGLRFGLFHVEVPAHNRFDYYYAKVYRGFKWLCTEVVCTISAVIDPIIPKILIDTWQPMTLPLFEFARVFDKIVPAVLVDAWLPLTKPISSLSAKVDKIVTGGMVSPWVKMPFTGKKRPKFEAKIDDAIQSSAQYLGGDEIRFKFEFNKPKTTTPWQVIVASFYLSIANLASMFDFNVVDGVVNGISKLAHVFSNSFSLFDKYVIDGVVNKTAKLVDHISIHFRKVQTGSVQNYLFAMLIGLIVIVSLFLFKVFDLSAWF